MGSSVDQRLCDPWFDECNDKQNIQLLQLFKLLTKKGENGCPVLATDAAISIGNLIVSLTPVQETPDYDITTGAGNLAAGFRVIMITNTGNGDGLLNGKTFRSGSAITYRASLNNTLAGISYDATGTEFEIATQQ